jgi:SAM-dependent methyltransferase
MTSGRHRWLVRSVLPRRWSIALWGDRDRWGPVADRNDPMWHEWEASYGDFYDASQRQGVGRWVNDAGYRVLSQIDLSGRVMLEIGPGGIRHTVNWNGLPAHVHLVDIDEDMASRGADVLNGLGVPHDVRLLGADHRLPFADGSIDVVVSFYSLEHIWPLQPTLDEIARVLAPDGFLVGAIPTEGGLAWGLGRLLTSRRWLRRHTTIDPDQLICWEHPNFADQIVDQLDATFARRRVRRWPLAWIPSIDANLLVTFVYRQVHS